MARLLFLVHGMGHHPNDDGESWSEEPRRLLRTAAEKYGIKSDFDQRVEIHEITYDDVFRRYLSEIGSSVAELRRVMEENATDGREVVRWLDDQDVTETKKNFFWSHVVDVLLYRFFPQIATEIRARVLQQFVQVVNAAEDAAPPRPRIAILAHSLGTSVTHDSLVQLSSQPYNGSRAFMAENNWRLHHLFALANVSRVLSRLGSGFYQSPVRSQTAPHVPGVKPCVARYLNFRHRLDPIPAVKAFSPVDWGADYVAEERLSQVLDWNIHSFGHYLRHPDVHVPILNELLDFPIGEDQQKDAVAELAAAPRPECIDVVDRLRGHLSTLRNLVANTPTVDVGAAVTLIKVATEALALMKEAEKDCQEVFR